jgi:hypothetical protein
VQTSLSDEEFQQRLAELLQRVAQLLPDDDRRIELRRALEPTRPAVVAFCGARKDVVKLIAGPRVYLRRLRR